MSGKDRIVPNPENKGWTQDGTTADGTPIYQWDGGRDTGNIINGTVEGEIATWDDTAGQWTPDPSLTIDDAGNVGIGNAGTVTPNSQGASLVVDTGKADDGMTIVGSNSASIFFADVAEARAGRILYLHSTDEMLFYTNGNVKRLTIDASGNATFTGSVSASELVAGNSWANDNKASIRASNGFGLLVKGVTGGNNLATFYAGGTAAGNQVAEIKSNGDATFSGAVRAADNTRINSTSTTGIYETNASASSEFVNLSPAPFIWRIGSYSNADKVLEISSSGDAHFSGTVITNSYIATNAGAGMLLTTDTVRSSSNGGIQFRAGAVAPVTSSGSASNGNIDLGTGSQRWKNVYGTTARMDRVIQDGSPVIDAKGLIKTLTTLRQATMDETQDIRESLRSAIDELVEGFEQEIAAMPAPEEA